jgi:outer membrane protein TolC
MINMRIRSRSLKRANIGAVVAFFAVAACIQSLSAEPKALSPEDVTSAALAGDPRVESARWDELSAQQKAKEAELRKLPSLSLSAGYTRLSDLSIPLSSLLGSASNLIPAKYVTMIDNWNLHSLDNEFSLGANMQYPVFAGFRLQESAKLAHLQAEGKGIATEMIRRSIVFEAQRAYWEAKRATKNVAMLKESLDLATQDLDLASKQVAQGTAMKADLLSAQMRADQAQMDLDAGVSAQRRAFWNLAALVEPTTGSESSPTADPTPEVDYSLTSEPQPVPDGRFTTLDEAVLIRQALNNRPETRASALSAVAAEVGRKIAEAPLYPTLSISGSYLYADPNPRELFQSDPTLFTGTWSLGVALTYDLGGLPANLAERGAQVDAVKKSQADDSRQRENVILDLRTCLQSFLQVRKDYGLVSGMIDQAKENERVIEQKVAAGTASDLDLLTAHLSRLKVEFSITNKLIDEQIAAADLERAAALAKL